MKRWKVFQLHFISTLIPFFQAELKKKEKQQAKRSGKMIQLYFINFIRQKRISVILCVHSAVSFCLLTTFPFAVVVFFSFCFVYFSSLCIFHVEFIWTMPWRNYGLSIAGKRTRQTSATSDTHTQKVYEIFWAITMNSYEFIFSSCHRVVSSHILANSAEIVQCNCNFVRSYFRVWFHLSLQYLSTSLAQNDIFGLE